MTVNVQRQLERQKNIYIKILFLNQSIPVILLQILTFHLHAALQNFMSSIHNPFSFPKYISHGMGKTTFISSI